MQRQLSRAKVDMVLFDVTTLYFESQKRMTLKTLAIARIVNSMKYKLF